MIFGIPLFYVFYCFVFLFTYFYHEENEKWAFVSADLNTPHEKRKMTKMDQSYESVVGWLLTAARVSSVLPFSQKGARGFWKYQK